MKPFSLLSLLPRYPREFGDRVSAIATGLWETTRGKRVTYPLLTTEFVLGHLSRTLDSNCKGFLADPELASIEMEVQERKSKIPLDGPFHMIYNGDSILGRFCYAITRAIKPRLVVETGVCYGVTSAYILRALDVNQRGALHSIDLPPLGKDGDKHVGRLIPDELRNR